MKKFALFCLVLCAALVANTQDLPYSKYLNFSSESNTWSLSKTNGWNEALNVLSIIADASEDMRPDVNDYSIEVQMGG